MTEDQNDNSMIPEESAPVPPPDIKPHGDINGISASTNGYVIGGADYAEGVDIIRTLNFTRDFHFFRENDQNVLYCYEEFEVDGEKILDRCHILDKWKEISEKTTKEQGR